MTAIETEMKEKIRYYVEKAQKRGLDAKTSAKFAAYNAKRWLELNHPEVPFVME